jgi:hypothetical protein
MQIDFIPGTSNCSFFYKKQEKRKVKKSDEKDGSNQANIYIVRMELAE